MERNPSTIHILGSRVDLVALPQVVARMAHWIDHPDGKCHRITVTGFHGLWRAYKDGRVHAALNSADLWVPDGIAPVWIARLRGIRGVQRLPGIELMEGFLELANEKGYRSFFYGDTEKTLLGMKAKVESHYPNHQVAGMFSPPYRPMTADEDRQIVQMINAAKPDVLWVALGLPKQDLWIFEHKDMLTVPVAIGVGAAFGFLAGTVKRVPKRVGDAGFEWAWRFVMEPRKLWRRGLLEAPQFVLHVALELAGIKQRAYDTHRADSEAGSD